MTPSLPRPPFPTPPRCPYAAPTLEHHGMWHLQTGQSCPPGIPLCPPINLGWPDSEEAGWPR
jgi:hypothetical protein